MTDHGVPLPRPWALRFFLRYFRKLFARHFAHVRWHALEDWRAWDRGVPVLAIANHTNWWDGFHSVLLTEEMGYTCHVLMEAANLDRYPPFKWIGTLPVRRDSPRGAYEDLVDYGRRLVPGRMCWIYPQGERRPALEPPTRLERGAAQLAIGHRGPLRILPVAFRYPFTTEQLPDAYALVGRSWLHEPREGDDRRSVSARFGEALVEVVGELDARLAGERLDDFRDLVPGRLSINKRLDRIRHRLGLLEGEFEERNG